jgi:protein gp37
VPLVFKQWGEWAPDVSSRPQARRLVQVDGTWMGRYGKKAAGRELDGATHDGYPEAGGE